MSGEEPVRVRRAFAFIDLAGFTALSEAHGDDAAARVALRLRQLAAGTLGPSVELVKSLGDAVMLAAARDGELLDTVEQLVVRCREEPGFLLARGGLHGGDAISTGSDYYGRAVNVAARVASLARSGQILMTGKLAAVAGERGRPAVSLGPARLPGLPEPVEIFAWDTGTGSAGIDPVCKMPVDVPAGRVAYGGRDYVFCSLECVRLFTAAPDAYLG